RGGKEGRLPGHRHVERLHTAGAGHAVGCRLPPNRAGLHPGSLRRNGGNHSPPRDQRDPLARGDLRARPAAGRVNAKRGRGRLFPRKMRPLPFFFLVPALAFGGELRFSVPGSTVSGPAVHEGRWTAWAPSTDRLFSNYAGARAFRSDVSRSPRLTSP